MVIIKILATIGLAMEMIVFANDREYERHKAGTIAAMTISGLGVMAIWV